jgi:hypothetical protein
VRARGIRIRWQIATPSKSSWEGRHSQVVRLLRVDVDLTHVIASIKEGGRDVRRTANAARCDLRVRCTLSVTLPANKSNHGLSDEFDANLLSSLAYVQRYVQDIYRPTFFHPISSHLPPGLSLWFVADHPRWHIQTRGFFILPRAHCCQARGTSRHSEWQ